MRTSITHFATCGTVLGVVLSLITVPTPLVARQQTSPPSVQFEVASVKINRNPPMTARAISLRASLSHGRLTFEALSLRNLILQAYSLQPNQVQGCPNWCDSDFFDVIAKAEDPDATPEQVRLMLQALLADRFHLVAHIEKKERPGYALVIRKGAPELKVSQDEETLGVAITGSLRTFTKMPIAGLVNLLAGAAGRPVVDDTGLKGLYDFTIDLTPPENGQRAAPAGIPTATDPIDGFARWSAAVEEQLGLGLEPRVITAENLSIDKVDRLSEN